MNITTTKNKNELDALVRKNIVMVLREILSDAEYHLPLKPAFLKKMQRSTVSKSKNKLISLDAVLKKYN